MYGGCPAAWLQRLRRLRVPHTLPDMGLQPAVSWTCNPSGEVEWLSPGLEQPRLNSSQRNPMSAACFSEPTAILLQQCPLQLFNTRSALQQIAQPAILANDAGAPRIISY